jgi:hypothetical protein
LIDAYWYDPVHVSRRRKLILVLWAIPAVVGMALLWDRIVGNTHMKMYGRIVDPAGKGIGVATM